MQLSKFNESASLTLLHTLYICSTGEPPSIFGMLSNEVTNIPESLSTCLTKMGKNLSPSLLLPSVANPCLRVNNSSYFRSLVICFATALVNICVVFMRSNWYFFTCLESGNMSLDSLTA